MLPLSEVLRVQSSVDDQWRSPVADAAAAAWGIPAGGALWWRSSAAHVFVVPQGVDERGVLYVRFIPAALLDRAAISVPTVLLSAMASAGSKVVAPVPSSSGSLVETVATPAGEYHVAVLSEAVGEERDVDDLTAEQAHEWGAALARFHRDAVTHASIVRDLDADSVARNSINPFLALSETEDTELRTAANALGERWISAIQDLPTGVLHGDFELDNLRGEGREIVAFDLDETSIGPFVIDIAAAVRDLVGDGRVFTDPEHPQFLSAFLAGYSTERALTPAEQDALALSTAFIAARSLVRGRGVRDAGTAADDPEWLRVLNAQLTKSDEEDRRIILGAV